MTTRSERLRAYFNFQGEPVNERHAKTRAVFDALVAAVGDLEIITTGKSRSGTPNSEANRASQALASIDKILDGEGT